MPGSPIDDGQRRDCPFCRVPAFLADDNPLRRLYECRTCFAVEVISKGGTWWYHGWEHPDGRRVDAAGRTSRRSPAMAFGWWDRTPPVSTRLGGALK